MQTPRPTLLLCLAATLTLVPRIASSDDVSTRPAATTDYSRAADDVMRHIQDAFYLTDGGLYAHSLADRHPDFTWGNGVMLTALLAAARHEPRPYAPILARFFASMDRYWDARAPIPGYEPAPTNGNGHDKYYDDNAWIALACIEAFEQTKDPRYLARARATQRFVLSGWDETARGGIWWHEGHKDDAKNTCVNAPAAVACLNLAPLLPKAEAAESIAMAKRIVDWTEQTLELDDGLFADRIDVATGTVTRDKLTYNTALMIRAFLGLHHATGDAAWLDKAKRSAAASDWFLDARTHAYRDDVKWSHLLVEADLELYRTTGDPHLLQRARANADYAYAQWQQHPPTELIENAAIARMLWLVGEADDACRDAAVAAETRQDSFGHRANGR